eukprot:TRINITY_DN757_c0_g1_i1.p1 TRINITY_DN757_c0_g1~~TRINITY_DN757_c0_g1_i1.p1  ORF type:complete len:258 (+),score=38.42 TRINITY_DN757_c0_g1_i1:74-847(+)
MTVVMKHSLYALVISLAIPGGASYEFAGNCVPGSIVAGLNQTGGRIGLYTMALQTIMPIYGNLALMAQGPNDQCSTAANAINLNLVKPKDIKKHFTGMKEIGALQSLKVGNKSGLVSYLYVFKAKTFIEYSEIADCVPGPIVKGLNQTGGRIALYSMALRTILPDLFGDLVYLGQGNTAACLDMMNHINMGNISISKMKKDAIKLGLKQIGILQGLKLAEDDKSYLYVFKNKMWNKTWEVMLPNLQSYGLPADFVMG